MAVTIASLVRQKSALKAKLTLLEKWLETAKDNKVREPEIKVKQTSLTKIAADLKTIEVEIYNYATDIELPDLQADILAMEERIEKNEVSLLDLISSISSTTSILNVSNVNNCNKVQATDTILPHIPLPSFSGRYEDFNSFKVTFENLITKNAQLTDSQKMFYLRASLKDKAANIQTSEDTYESLFKALEERYQNKRILVDTHIHNIMNYPKVTNESARDLQDLIDCLKKNLRALKLLDYDRDKLSDILLLNVICQKIDRESRKQYELSINSKEVPELDELISFLEKRIQTLENISRNLLSSSKTTSKPFPAQPFNRPKNLFVKNEIKKCIVCNSTIHTIYKCPVFKDMVLKQRIEFIKKHRLCFNCLNSHLVIDCPSNSVCNVCQRKHHSTIHRYDISYGFSSPDKTRESMREAAPEKISQSRAENESDSSFKQMNQALFNVNREKTVLLSTCKIDIYDINNQKRSVICILDSGSMANFITATCANLLGMRKEKIDSPISGLNNSIFKVKSKINATISDRKGEYQWNVDLLLVPKICEFTPCNFLKVPSIDIPKGLELADPEFFKPKRVDLLLGNELFFEFIKARKIHLSDNLYFQETVFGYIAAGSLEVQRNFAKNQISFLATKFQNLEKTLESFWKVENVEECSSSHSDELEICNQHFEKTHYRKPDGRYVVQMPMKTDNNLELGSSIEIASKRLDQLWTRLDRQPAMRKMYLDFMAEYERLQHMEECQIDNSFAYYLPHHGVYRADKSSTKLRVVFNASAKTSNGKSLNDILLKGGTIQDELFNIILRFRKHIYAFTADIKMMYRQIEIDQSQLHLQRILWKDSKQAPVKCYQLRTVTYGTASAPFLATKTLQQLARVEARNFPLASAVVRSDFYVDDVLSGDCDLQKVEKLCSELQELLQCGQMSLHKWHSNFSTLESCSEKTNYLFSSENDTVTTTKTLGLLWNTTYDTFSFKVQINQSSSCTKREVLSDIARIYDPLGLVGPVLTTAKIFMQSLWLLKLDWQQQLPASFAKQWNEFVSTLKAIENLQIPRCILTKNVTKVNLYGFADASVSAYGAVIYVQVISDDGQISSQLLCSKSRVAPIKTLTIPRLELSACLLLAQLMTKIVPALKLEINSIRLWTDSTIALAWIKTSPHLLKTFVSNRVAKIQRLSNHFTWGHVTSMNNPADCISRGQNAEEILCNKLWWNGPHFLSQELCTPKTEPINCEEKSMDNAYLKEFKTTTCALTLTHENNLFTFIMTLTNSFIKLIKIVVYIFRFIYNLRNPLSKRRGVISTLEFKEARDALIKNAQVNSFNKEMSKLKKGNEVKKDSKLKSLNPFLDNNGILRVGGRLSHSNVSYNKKHPIILPSNNKLTRMIFEYFHQKYLHVGPQNLLYNIRQTYWPLRGKDTARQIVHNCLKCFRTKPILSSQIMGDLPPERVTPSPPFSNTGIDFCGPFSIKHKYQRKGPFQTIYVAIFICLATKAVHFEVVTDLTSEALIAALKRFFSRRGKATSIFSDNATNFVGAHSELKRLSNLVTNPNNNLAEYFISEGVNWKFQPPRAPNFGGLWEAGVKSFKFHFKRSIGNLRLTLEEFTTIMVQIEGILNSRPLTPLSSDEEIFEALTPGHFLIGRPINAIQEPSLIEKRDNLLSKWQKTTKIFQTIWKKWHHDYLSHLNQRYKWQFKKNNVTTGTMVLIKEENLPPLKWIIGRITEVIYGKDNNVRVVMVKTSKGLFKRPISKICILPIDN